MSINVNVTGNPVKIHRGKMVTITDLDNAKEEFQRRRRMRLEQVRQQSKDIAETLRNKVQKEKSKQLCELEKRGEKELKKWQARKLLQLQQQYHECLEDIGLGHSEAVLEEESDFALQSLKDNFNRVAKEREQHAVEKLQQQRDQGNLHKTTGFQKRRYNQAIENTRAKLIANLNRKKKKLGSFKRKKRKVSTDINISSRLSSDSDGETEVPELFNLYSSSSGNTEKLLTKTSKKYLSSVSKEPTGYTVMADAPSKEEVVTERQDEAVKKRTEPVLSPTRQKLEDNVSGTYPLDTRISDRIKNRKILNGDYEPCINLCDISTSGSVLQSRKIFTKNNEKYDMSRNSLENPSLFENSKAKPISSNSEQFCGVSELSSSKYKQEQILKKPTVTLQTAPVSLNKLNSFLHSNARSNKVQYYDHKNRFTKEYKVDNSNVQRIADENIEVCPSTGSEVDVMEQMYKRDHDALVRGQKALEKEKIHRNYQEMMQQLPVLQKQENLAAISMKKSTLHMSENRLKQSEKKKQNRMKNAYEKSFLKAPVITIPPKNQTKTSIAMSTLPFHTIDVNNSHPSINVSSWDFDIKRNYTRSADLPPEQVESNLVKDNTEKVVDEKLDLETTAVERRKNLQEMLQSLQFHRDKLAKEISSLPESSTLHKLVGELGSIDRFVQIGQAGKKEFRNSRKQKRSRCKRKQQTREENNSKVSSSSLSPSYKLKKSFPETAKRGELSRKNKEASKYHVRCISSSSSSFSPPLKILSSVKTKTERKLIQPSPLILQNSSTQTTPTMEKLTKLSDKQSHPVPSTKEHSNEPNINKKNIGPCKCYLHTERGESQLCEIVIKISEDGKPQICFSPIKLKDKQIIVKTGNEEVRAASVQLPSVGVKDKKLDKLESLDISKSKLAEKQEQLDKAKSVNQQKTADDRDEKLKGKDQNKCKKQKPISSWREYLSQNSTSSTSYFSPPDFTNTHFPQSCSKYQPHDNDVQKSAGRLVNILKDKPQQSNLQQDSTMSSVSSTFQNSKLIEPHLLCYISKLLNMSRSSIDDLPVSSVSDVSTPNSSIVNMQSNVPLQYLENIIKHFNINVSDLEGLLSYSPDESNVHYNTAESLTPSSTDDSKSVNNPRDTATIKSQAIGQNTIDNYSAEHYPGVLAVYNKLAANCAKKIENLAVMIEKIRLEKVNMLRNSDSGSDKENSTKYLDLPAELRQQPGRKKNDSPASSSPEQEELDRQLLEIDYSFAERLKKMTPAEIREQFPLSGSSDSGGSNKETNHQNDSIDNELMKRFRDLVGHKSDKIGLDQPRDSAASMSEIKYDLPFVPLLVDIPFGPKLESSFLHPSLRRNNERSKPPPSKGLTVAKRFSNNINAIPHELSTIVESESLVSSRLHRSKTPESQTSNKGISPKQRSYLEEQPVSLMVPPTTKDKMLKDPTDPSEMVEEKNDTLQTSSNDSLPDILMELMKNATALEEQPRKSTNKSSENHKTETLKQSSHKNTVEAVPSDSSTGELENMEAVLKSLGMGWAVATLRKTQEALALTSSTSSIDISLKHKEIKLTDTSSTSEVSLREMLGRQFLAKLSSSNGRSDDTNGSSQFFRDLQDLSEIYGSEMSYEKTTRRTSTPVQSSKLVDKSKNDSRRHTTVTGESELSSVKAISDINCDRENFYSLNESSVRSKSNSKND